MSTSFKKMPNLRSLLPVVLALAFGVRPSSAQTSSAYSRIALKIDNLLIVGNRMDMAIACIVRTPISDQELEKRRLDPAQWRSNYCRQAVSIVEPWARRFRRHGNFQILPRGIADAAVAKLKVDEDGEVAPEQLQDLGRGISATHLLLVEEKILPHGRQLTEQRILKLVDLQTGDVLAEDSARF